MKSKITVKLIITGVVLLSALALLALGTFAWFTLSKKGEVGGIGIRMEKSDAQWPFEIVQHQDEWRTIEQVMNYPDWEKNLTLKKVKTDSSPEGREIGDCYQLRPISTYDGVHWYLADYDTYGNVAGVKGTDLAAVGNINRYNPYPEEDDKDVPANYVYYYDVWIRTRGESQNAYTLHLNNPLSMDNLLNDEMLFGTYVLPGIIQDPEGQATMSQAGYDASTCLRVGFLFYNQNEGDSMINVASPSDNSHETPGVFWIYEPNSDIRAKYFTQYGGTGLVKHTYEMQKGITYIAGEGQTTVVGDHINLKDGNILDTSLPKASGSEVTYEIQQNTIKQKASAWDMGKVRSKSSPDKVNSRDIDHFGKFISHNNPEREGYDGIDTPGMITIEPGKPQHVRIFIWMEGQDVDCWNSSLTGKLAINLEFRGEAVENNE